MAEKGGWGREARVRRQRAAVAAAQARTRHRRDRGERAALRAAARHARRRRCLPHTRNAYGRRRSVLRDVPAAAHENRVTELSNQKWQRAACRATSKPPTASKQSCAQTIASSTEFAMFLVLLV
jgi:hypothetical protein